MSAAHLRRDQRTAQDALALAHGLRRTIESGALAAGNVVDGTITRADLAPGLTIIEASPSPQLLVAVARPAPRRDGSVELSARQLVINQRIAQAAIRRVAEVSALIGSGLQVPRPVARPLPTGAVRGPGDHLGTMPPTFPPDPDDESQRRFQVTSNYLSSVAVFLRTTYGQGEALYAGLADVVRGQAAYHQVNRSKGLPADRIRRLLHNAWSTENLMRLPHDFLMKPIIGTANVWAPVQSYYAAFSALQAWYAVNGISARAGDHRATLSVVATMIRDRGLFPPPWCLLAVGCPDRDRPRQFLNVPPGADCHRPVKVLSRPQPFGHDASFWPRLATWLATTRVDRLKKHEAEWKKSNKKQRIPGAQRDKLAAGVPPTSLFDCLFRMRVRSNYGDVDPFMAIYLDEHDHFMFSDALCTVTSASLGLLELLVMRKLGTDGYRDMATDFIARASAKPPPALAARLRAFGLVETPSASPYWPTPPRPEAPLARPPAEPDGDIPF